MKKLAIYGAGGLGKEVKTLVDAVNYEKPVYDFLGFFDDNKEGKEVIGNLECLNLWDENLFLIVAIGSPTIKEQVVSLITNNKIQFETIVHPLAVIGNKNTVKLGEGTIVTAGCVLTTDIIIGDHVLINLNATIGHDCIIGAYSSIMPGVNVAGAVNIERSVLAGSGANILNAVHIGQQAVVGAGAVVLKDVKAFTTVIGVPAREK